MNTVMLKYLATVVAGAGMLGLTGCFAKHTVAKLWTPDQANLEVDPAPSGAATPKTGEDGRVPSPAPTQAPLAKGPVVSVTYQLVQPATAVNWARAKIQPDIYHLERDVSKTLKGLPANWSAERVIPRDEFESLEEYNRRISSMKNATDRVHYLIVSSDFTYNFDTKQFLVLPEMPGAAPVKATSETAKPAPQTARPEPPKRVVPSPVPVNPATVLDAYYGANALYNAGGFLEASKAYLGFIRDHPEHGKILHVQLGLALCHFSMGQLDTAEPWLESLSNNPNAPLPATVKSLLEQCRAIRASGRKVKGGMVFELQLEEKPGATPAPETPKECTPPEAPDTHKLEQAPIVIPELPSPTASIVTAGGLFRPWETPPTELTLLHQYGKHPTFFKTGVLHVPKIRENFEAEYKKEGRSGWLLPRAYEPAIARTLKSALHLVVGCQLERQPDSSVLGNYRDAFQLVSLHVISMDGDDNITGVHYAADLKPVTAP